MNKTVDLHLDLNFRKNLDLLRETVAKPANIKEKEQENYRALQCYIQVLGVLVKLGFGLRQQIKIFQKLREPASCHDLSSVLDPY